MTTHSKEIVLTVIPFADGRVYSGEVIGVKAVTDEHEIMMITDAGIIIQLRMEDIPTHGRITSGVKMINLDEEVKVAKIAKVREKVTEDGQEIDLNDESDEVSEDVTETEAE